MLVRAFGVWLLLLFLAIANGAIRTLALSPYMTETAARFLSTLLLCLAIALLAHATITWVGPQSARQALGVGVLWCGLTLAFEFLAGHYLFRTPWDALLADYDLAAGRIWILAPVVCLLAPLWAARRRRLLSGGARVQI